MFVFVYLYGLRSTHTDLYIDKVPDLLSRVAELEVQVSASHTYRGVKMQMYHVCIVHACTSILYVHIAVHLWEIPKG